MCTGAGKLHSGQQGEGGMGCGVGEMGQREGSDEGFFIIYASGPALA